MLMHKNTHKTGEEPRAIKKIFSKQLPITENRSDVRLKRHERGIWQRRFLRHAQDRFGSMHSVTKQITSGMLTTFINNPVKHGWVTRVTDWQYSSFHRFVERGIYSPEWVTAVDLHYNFDKS